MRDVASFKLWYSQKLKIWKNPCSCQENWAEWKTLNVRNSSCLYGTVLSYPSSLGDHINSENILAEFHKFLIIRYWNIAFYITSTLCFFFISEYITCAGNVQYHAGCSIIAYTGLSNPYINQAYINILVIFSLKGCI